VRGSVIPIKPRIHDPAKAPIIPTMMFQKIPICALFLVTMLATQPANPPKTIQANQLMFITSLYFIIGQVSDKMRQPQLTINAATIPR
jgi:hypothetical protein